MQLVELEDQKWFPGWMRQYQVDFLGAVSRLTGLYKPCANLLKSFNAGKIIDLASGNGQSAQTVLSKLDGVEVIYTDKFPPNGQLEIIPLDLLRDSFPKADFYTMFNGLHHFSKAELASIIYRISTESHFLFIEPIGPRFGSLLKVALSTFILPFFLVPFLRPFRWDRIIITYIVPIGPLICFYDGIISVLKSYSQKELEQLAVELSSTNRKIKTGRVKSPFTTFNYISS